LKKGIYRMFEKINKKEYLFCFFLIFMSGESADIFASIDSHEKPVSSQSRKNVHRPFDGEAKWIWTATGTRQAKHHIDNYRVAYFRRSFTVLAPAPNLIIHVSADSRYILWFNGQYIGRGPAKGDIAHQFYDTYDISHLLRKGKNVLAAHVMSFAPSWVEYNVGSPPASIMTATNGFVLDGRLKDADGNDVENLCTDALWLVAEDSAYYHEPRPEVKAIVGLFENFRGKNYPWGWQEIDFDEKGWQAATVMTKAVRPDNVADSFMPHRLIPRIIPFMEEKNERFSGVIDSYGVERKKASDLIRNDTPMKIPANSQVKITFDTGQETTAFPLLGCEGGQDAEIRIKYAETLFRNGEKLRIPDDQPFEFIGYWDRCWPGGGKEIYEPFLWRTFRFVELAITTGEQPLVINRFSIRFNGYPFQMQAQFETSDPDFARIWEVSWRTLRLCAHEAYDDGPYWEQLQYAGDLHVSSLLAYNLAADYLLTRQALRHFDWSRTWEGITQSRYPSRVPQIIPFWSLHWIFMNYDYYYHSGDLEEIRQRFNGLISVLEWFLPLINAEGLISKVPYWCVADWSPDWKDPKWGSGIPPGTKDGPSAMINLMYIAALRRVSELADHLGKQEQVDVLKQRADRMTDAVNQMFWSEKENLYTDRPAGTEVSQLTNAWAILSKTADEKRAKFICQRLIDDSTLCRAAYFGKFFIFRALSGAGEYNRAFPLFEAWRNMLKMGCTTWPEDPSLGRSECHVWSSAPAYDFLAEILGVKPLAPGFDKILIRPHPGDLQWARGAVPTPHGEVTVYWRFEKKSFILEGEAPKGIPVQINMPGGARETIPDGGKFSFSEPEKF